MCETYSRAFRPGNLRFQISDEGMSTSTHVGSFNKGGLLQDEVRQISQNHELKSSRSFQLSHNPARRRECMHWCTSRVLLLNGCGCGICVAPFCVHKDALKTGIHRVETSDSGAQGQHTGCLQSDSPSHLRSHLASQTTRPVHTSAPVLLLWCSGPVLGFKAKVHEVSRTNHKLHYTKHKPPLQWILKQSTHLCR